MSEKEQPAPRAFISYSWSNSDHEAWVLDLATQLRESGIDAILDKWDLREGQEAYAFMESMVTDNTVQKVIIVSDEQYATKSNERRGGAGAEAQIISKKLFEMRDQSKFAALITERDDNGNAHLPAYYTSRIYIDFSDPTCFADSFEQLLRWLFDKPLNVRPALGKKPVFLDDDHGVKLATNTEFMRAQSSIRDGRLQALTSVQDFFAKVIEQLPLLGFEGNPCDDYDRFTSNIAAFIPYRNQIIEIVNLIAKNRLNVEFYEAIHRFIEEFMHLFNPAKGVNNWREINFDNFRFWGYEIFLYIVAILVKERALDGLDIILSKPFYIENSRKNDKIASTSELYYHLKSFEYWNEKNNLRKLSLTADFIHNRSKGSGIHFHNLAQADFILYLRGVIHDANGINSYRWFPLLLIYHDGHDGPFEVFARAVSSKEFPIALRLLGLKNKTDLDIILKPFADGIRQGPSFGGFSDHVYPPALIGYDKLCTRP